MFIYNWELGLVDIKQLPMTLSAPGNNCWHTTNEPPPTSAKILKSETKEFVYASASASKLWTVTTQQTLLCFLFTVCVAANVLLHWHSRLHRDWSVIVSNFFLVPTGMRVIKQICHALTGHYTSPNPPMMRNQVLWKNPYAQPIITFEESVREQDWVTDCYSQGNLFRRKDFNQDSLLSKAYYIGHVWSGNLIKEQWYTNGCSYFLRTSLNVSLEH